MASFYQASGATLGANTLWCAAGFNAAIPATATDVVSGEGLGPAGKCTYQVKTAVAKSGLQFKVTATADLTDFNLAFYEWTAEDFVAAQLMPATTPIQKMGDYVKGTSTLMTYFNPFKNG